MVDRGRLVIAALASLAACAGGDEGSGTDAATGSGAPTSTSGDPGGSTGDATGDATGATDDSPGATDPGASTGEDAASTGDAPPDGVFVAVGDGGVRARSIDGIEWTAQIGSGLPDLNDAMAPPDALRALAVGDGGVVVAVGGGGTGSSGTMMVMRSDDGGLSWQEDLLAAADLGSKQRLHGVAYDAGVFVAAGMRGKRIRSEDGGLTWTEAPAANENARLLAVAAGGGVFVVGGWTQYMYDGPVASALSYSADAGLTWSPLDESFARIDDVAYGAGQFVAVGETQCLRSPDGAAWTDCGVAGPLFFGVDAVGEQLVLIASDGLRTSSDGQLWSDPLVSPVGSPTELARGNGRHVGVRWTDRGWADSLETWTFATYAEQPLRAIAFVKTM